MPIEIRNSIHGSIEDLYLCMMKGNESTNATTYEDITYKQTNITDLTFRRHLQTLQKLGVYIKKS